MLLGGLGIDRFYLGKIGTGILKLLTGGGAGIWSLVDLILVLAGKQTDRYGRPLAGYAQNKIKALIITVVVYVLSWILTFVMISSAMSGTSRAPQSAASGVPSPAASTAAPLSVIPSPTQTQTVAAPPAAPTAPPQPVLPTKTYTGTGDDVVAVDFAGQPAVVAFECTGCTSNTVLNSNGSDSLLVNAIGPYSGTHIVDAMQGTPTTQLEVKADAPWKLTISDPSTLPKTTGPVSGHGDTAIFIAGNTSKATIQNTGQSNFVVTGYGEGFPQLAVNEIGNYSGTVLLTGPAFVQVISDGDWSLTPQ